MDRLERAVDLAGLLLDQIEKERDAAQQLEKAKAARLRTEREDLPMLMEELGLSELTLDSGERITLKEDVFANITEVRAAAAMRWLTENNFSGIIKTQLKVDFARAEYDEALTALNLLKEEGYQPELKEGVHPQTLKAFVREQLEAGTNIPFDLFGVQPFNKAIVKKGK